VHPVEHDLGRPVPSRGHVPGHLALSGTRQAKVQDAQLAVLVHRDVRGLQVAMDDPGAVDVLQTAQDLVDQKLNVVVGQLLGAYDVVQIGVHQVGHHVDLLKLFQRIGGLSGMKDVQQTDDVLVVHVLQQSQLPIRPLGVDGRLEGPGQLLDGHLGACSADHGLAHLPVSSLANGLQVLVRFRYLPLGAVDVQLIELGHFARHCVAIACAQVLL